MPGDQGLSGLRGTCMPTSGWALTLPAVGVPDSRPAPPLIPRPSQWGVAFPDTPVPRAPALLIEGSPSMKVLPADPNLETPRNEVPGGCPAAPALSLCSLSPGHRGGCRADRRPCAAVRSRACDAGWQGLLWSGKLRVKHSEAGSVVAGLLRAFNMLMWPVGS